jgi:hypothetical protein
MAASDEFRLVPDAGQFLFKLGDEGDDFQGYLFECLNLLDALRRPDIFILKEILVEPEV